MSAEQAFSTELAGELAKLSAHLRSLVDQAHAAGVDRVPICPAKVLELCDALDGIARFMQVFGRRVLADLAFAGPVPADVIDLANRRLERERRELADATMRSPSETDPAS